MADTTIDPIRQSPEQVAYQLLELIAYAEGKKLAGSFPAGQTPDRKWILDTYNECLRVVKQSPAPRQSTPGLRRTGALPR